VLAGDFARRLPGELQLRDDPRDGLLLFTIGWFDWTNDKTLGETGLVVIDTESDRLVRADVNDSSGGITTPVNLASGDTYLLSSALAADYRLGRLATPPCALRILANEDTFDAGYAQPLADLVGGALSSEPVHAGGNSLYLRVLDEGSAVVEAGQFSWDITGQSVRSWARWDVSQNAAVGEPSAGSVDCGRGLVASRRAHVRNGVGRREAVAHAPDRALDAHRWTASPRGLPSRPDARALSSLCREV